MELKRSILTSSDEGSKMLQVDSFGEAARIYESIVRRRYDPAMPGASRIRMTDLGTESVKVAWRKLKPDEYLVTVSMRHDSSDAFGSAYSSDMPRFRFRLR
jgi:hypothetical protein